MKAWTLRATVAACTLMAAASANALLLDFKVNENVIPGSAAGSVSLVPFLPNASDFTADKLTGGYVERFQVTGMNTFATSAIFKGSSFFANEGGALISPTVLNSGEAIGGYQLYSIFTATGTFTPTGGGGVNFTGATATFELYADTNSDSGANVLFNAGNVNDLTVYGTDIGNTDLLLARSSTLIVGAGNFSPGVANGDFAIVFAGLDQLSNGVTDGLTALGQQYFYDPSPFYDWVRISGQFDTFTLPSMGGTVEFQGSADITFVPEPGSLALAGLALSALGLSLRRRKV